MDEHENKKGEELVNNKGTSENNNQDGTKVIDYGSLRIRYNGIFYDKKIEKKYIKLKMKAANGVASDSLYEELGKFTEKHKKIFEKVQVSEGNKETGEGRTVTLNEVLFYTLRFCKELGLHRFADFNHDKKITATHLINENMVVDADAVTCKYDGEELFDALKNLYEEKRKELENGTMGSYEFGREFVSYYLNKHAKHMMVDKIKDNSFDKQKNLILMQKKFLEELKKEFPVEFARAMEKKILKFDYYRVFNVKKIDALLVEMFYNNNKPTALFRSKWNEFNERKIEAILSYDEIADALAEDSYSDNAKELTLSHNEENFFVRGKDVYNIINLMKLIQKETKRIHPNKNRRFDTLKCVLTYEAYDKYDGNIPDEYKQAGLIDEKFLDNYQSEIEESIKESYEQQSNGDDQGTEKDNKDNKDNKKEKENKNRRNKIIAEYLNDIKIDTVRKHIEEFVNLGCKLDNSLKPKKRSVKMEDLLKELRASYGPNAEFRDGQKEAIQAVLDGERTLVVQRTGWGKSLVYFLATKILKQRNPRNLTIIISPLLSLMDNQIESAKVLGINVVTINSQLDDKEQDALYQDIVKDNNIDALIIAPERLVNEQFKQFIFELESNRSIGLFVVDEAHCISDWGHDFRKSYRLINRLIEKMPKNTAILATTATANSRVCDDVAEQLDPENYGKDHDNTKQAEDNNNEKSQDNDEKPKHKLKISRGSLMRKSLDIQLIQMDMIEERLAWLAQNLRKGPLAGTGIIYCLTTRDCDYVHAWLQSQGIKSARYYSDVMDTTVEAELERLKQLGEEEENGKKLNKEDIKNRIIKSTKAKAVQLFMNNEIDVLVATVAFGMGFDKKDIAYIVHFQKPGNVVAYYQQIGRAGRGIDKATAIMLWGKKDDDINNSFIRKAFPKKEEYFNVYNTLTDFRELTTTQLSKESKVDRSTVDSILQDFVFNNMVRSYYINDQKKETDSETKRYKSRGPKLYAANIYDKEKIKSEIEAIITSNDNVTKTRNAELVQINRFLSLGNDECYMDFLAKALDDSTSNKCGHCAHCLGKAIVSPEIDPEMFAKALHFSERFTYKIESRKLWSDNRRIPKEYLVEDGQSLCLYRLGVLGEQVYVGKYIDQHFSDELVEAAVACVRSKFPMSGKGAIKWVTNIPSKNHPTLVADFAARVAKALGLEYAPVLEKIQDTPQQKNFTKKQEQQENAEKSFGLAAELPEYFGNNVLLIDDMVDSKWTFTVCGKLLREAGSGKVYPLALANSSNKKSGDE